MRGCSTPAISWVLTLDDVLSGRDFPDTVARSKPSSRRERSSAAKAIIIPIDDFMTTPAAKQEVHLSLQVARGDPAE